MESSYFLQEAAPPKKKQEKKKKTFVSPNSHKTKGISSSLPNVNRQLAPPTRLTAKYKQTQTCVTTTARQRRGSPNENAISHGEVEEELEEDEEKGRPTTYCPSQPLIFNAQEKNKKKTAERLQTSELHKQDCDDLATS